MFSATQIEKSLEYTRMGRLNSLEDLWEPQTQGDEKLWCSKALDDLISLGISKAVAIEIIMQTKGLTVSQETLAKFYQDQAAAADQDLDRRVSVQQ